MPTVQFVPFATAVGANIDPPADYIILPVVQTGVQPGIASSKLNNNSIRQATFMAAALANVIANLTGSDVLDDGNLNAMVALLTETISLGSVVQPTRIQTASGAFVTAVVDSYIGLNRTAAVAPSSTTLNALSAVGQEFIYADLAGNFNANPLTVAAPAGHNIAGAADFVCNVDRATYRFHYYGNNTWGVEQ